MWTINIFFTTIHVKYFKPGNVSGSNDHLFQKNLKKNNIIK